MANTTSNDEPNPDLFWLPARLHPEIAPQEFKAFIEEATKPENLLRRTSSALGARRTGIQTDSESVGSHHHPQLAATESLGRKKSMLRQVYNPTQDDHLPNQQHTPTQSSSSPSLSSPSSASPSPSTSSVTRGYSMSSRTGIGRGLEGLESLTINDLQRLESLVLKKPVHSLIDSSEGDIDQFDKDGGGNRIKAVLRRSMSMGGAAALTAPLEVEEITAHEAIDDSPLISRGPGHIIRRTARTKVRKVSLPGDGGGHRFPATRRPKRDLGPLGDDDGESSRTSLDRTPSRREALFPAEEPDSIHALHHPTPDTPPKPPRISSDDCASETDQCEGPSPPRPYSSTGHLMNSLPSRHSSVGYKQTAPKISSASHHTPQHIASSEDDHSTKSMDSIVSNSSLLEAYIDENFTDNSLTPTQSNSFEFSNLSASSDSSSPSSSNHLNTIVPKVSSQSTFSGAPPTIDHLPTLASDTFPTLDPSISSSISTPYAFQTTSAPQPQQPPANLKNATLKIQPPSIKPIEPTRGFSRSSEDLTSASSLPSATTTSSATTAMTSPMTAGSTTSPSIPYSPVTTPSKTTRPVISKTKTSPNLSTPTAKPVEPVITTKEVKEKKRAWAKLGLSSSSASSSGEKAKKDKAKEKATKGLSGQDAKKIDMGTSGGNVTASSVNASASGPPGTKKESGFLSGLFGGKSKKQESEAQQSNGAKEGKQVAQSTKSKQAGQDHHAQAGAKQLHAAQPVLNPTASGGIIKGKYTSFYRLPIHVERAVYRLSHIKLANPRRPLYEQVLISNLMFWYLGVINKNTTTNGAVSHPQSSDHSVYRQVEQKQVVEEQKKKENKKKSKQKKDKSGGARKNKPSESESESEIESLHSSDDSSSSSDDDDERPLGKRINRAKANNEDWNNGSKSNFGPGHQRPSVSVKKLS